jgi:hypothetical protein
LAWYFASRFTALDSFEKRNQKGYLITAGDEWMHESITGRQLSKIFGGQCEDLTIQQMLEQAQRMYHVYHIHISHYTGMTREEMYISKWRELLGENLIVLEDYNNIAQTISDIVVSGQRTLHHV